MVRRRLTVKRLDPWSVLKFGALASVVLLAIFLLVMGIVWFIIDRLQLVDQVCGIATDVGFTSCGVNASNLFRALVLLGLLWVVVQTAVLVFMAFLHNLIADLTGGLVIGVIEDATVTRPEQAGPLAGATVNTTNGGRGSSSFVGGPGRASPPQTTPPPRQAEPSAPTPSRVQEQEDLFGGS